ncbi:peptide synthetase [Pseudomonas sp. Choline-3u-10]|jgi:D-alanine--poly(phosphoribitol) ligase subunit 1|uniref:amino acid adenylation domain-containing protein n=1 Tax=Pseudomonadaceae TaxID=135621 RepID=UPI0006181A59|nr:MULTISPECIES: amino acid adenylation domain-containing protein [Pseudomonadaceae]MAL36852.1 peptide synthetase [Pseudomonas sp.]MBU0950765.1 amino acid adenylation domain-containing protein [Gammaproteobacteria bacterium]KJJ65216.1 peptide synthetase [Pseudomonas sp. 10B238]MBK3795555.1 amino acid adenylation domain-containing protein [Stutzerimonas stutzeri]MBK3878090.1 amino acid adenylation domain-containing protein [Stutzerimonas stutzeri]
MTSLNLQLAHVFARHAERPALGCLGASFSYAELQARVAAIVLQLRADGLTAGDRVGLHLSRGPDLIAALLACLQEGLCFVPLEPEFPLDRLQGIADDACLHRIIQDEQPSRSLAPSLRLRPGLAAMPEPLVLDDQLPAYMMFTSGSTGKPKGVVIGRAALSNFLDAAARRVGIGPDTRWLFTTTPAFDISLLEMLGPLWVGGYVEVVCAPAHKDPVALLQLLDSRPDLNTLQATPAFWRMLLKAGWQGREGLTALCGGEALDATLAARLSESVGQLWNCYGPTEATVWSMMAPVEQPLADHGVRLKQSLDGYRHWVLDENGNDIGPGGEGELCIEGVSLAQGYWQRSDLNEQAFISWQGRRLYRTGDRVRRIGDEELQYLGRRDDQIKLRGFRIELGEIEANLRRIEGVQDAAVRLLGKGDEACLVGYVETRGEGAPGRVQIRRALHLSLPHYMVPSRIVLLDSLPKTPSGKIDRKRLPEPV